jgi:hypothetical protein
MGFEKGCVRLVGETCGSLSTFKRTKFLTCVSVPC